MSTSAPQLARPHHRAAYVVGRGAVRQHEIDPHASTRFDQHRSPTRSPPHDRETGPCARRRVEHVALTDAIRARSRRRWARTTTPRPARRERRTDRARAARPPSPDDGHVRRSPRIATAHADGRERVEQIARTPWARPRGRARRERKRHHPGSARAETGRRGPRRRTPRRTAPRSDHGERRPDRARSTPRARRPSASVDRDSRSGRQICDLEGQGASSTVPTEQGPRRSVTGRVGVVDARRPRRDAPPRETTRPFDGHRPGAGGLAAARRRGPPIGGIGQEVRRARRRRGRRTGRSTPATRSPRRAPPTSTTTNAIEDGQGAALHPLSLPRRGTASTCRGRAGRRAPPRPSPAAHGTGAAGACPPRRACGRACGCCTAGRPRRGSPTRAPPPRDLGTT